ncbi:CpsB/CapC family capsule biosynthesis tyrosine phosphatase [Gracilibacillus sp. S3-1-1]|uniref:CpsB/CapC family capsule biosynthesis tyrosine phosphatase n=1 Tax=Gracilibacillus pellucidus TaxID=3095368 RepID=A0ACC6M864_9BACI|nr:CpsB/CapC family capsule biosynthesis tyrosine phosphatase [Gracilibacillus sp. S3-1-1]MDX8047120.1 CpsB/CapC family capsule biosynthesis tyrosine phosphatase [Gracilibacillus sp. S3-1-1]
MIDIHCHILPNVDDGAKHMEDSVQMAKSAVSQGITTIIATPHHMNGSYDNYKEDILVAVECLNDRLQEEEIPLTILPGQETRIYGEMLEDLEKGQLLPLNETSGYLFVELPSNHVPRYTKQLLFDLQLKGVKPVIVHPERNKELMENPDILYDLVSNGTLTQVTAASIAGKFGKKIKKFSSQMIEANLTHFIASDAHNTTTRGFVMQDALSIVKNEYGTSMVYWFMENAQYLVNGEIVVGDVPEKIKKKKVLGIF